MTPLFVFFRSTFKPIAAGLLCLGVWGHSAALAGSFKVSPVRIDLSAAEPTAIVTVRNESDTHPVVIQAEPRRWTQREGKDRYEAGPEFIASPPIFSLQPGATQIVRVGLRNPVGGTEEAAYRLYLNEMPGPPDEGKRGLRVTLNVAIPVFFAPQSIARAEPQWQATYQDSRTLTLQMENPGNRHVHLKEVRLFDAASAQPLAVSTEPRYALAHQDAAWTLTLLRPPQGAVRVVARAGEGTLEARVLIENRSIHRKVAARD